VKFDVLPGFAAEYDRLPEEHKALFRAAIRLINQTYTSQRDDLPIRWPPELRVKRVRGTKRAVWEMTRNFQRPSGRATFELIQIDGEPAILWRRIGGHEIFGEP
jgi:hypothetical protein